MTIKSIIAVWIGFTIGNFIWSVLVGPHNFSEAVKISWHQLAFAIVLILFHRD